METGFLKEVTGWLFLTKKVTKEVLGLGPILLRSGLKSTEHFPQNSRDHEPHPFLLRPTRPFWSNMMVPYIHSSRNWIHTLPGTRVCFSSRLIHHEVFPLEENIHLQVELPTIWACVIYSCSIYPVFVLLKSNILCTNLCTHTWSLPKAKFQGVELLD